MIGERRWWLPHPDLHAAPIELMARRGGWVMVRRSDERPFVLAEVEWDELPSVRRTDAALLE